jgi:hypothetical protein
MKYGNAYYQDPRDKVYALLTLMPEALWAKMNLMIDYNVPLLDLSLKLAKNRLREASQVVPKQDQHVRHTSPSM